MKKAETDQKYEEMDLKFKETDQQIEIFKVFGKSGNGSKIWGNRPKIWGNRSTNWDCRSFKTIDQKYEETNSKYKKFPQKYFFEIKCKCILNFGNSIKKEETPKNSTFEGFPKKSKNLRKCIKFDWFPLSLC